MSQALSILLIVLNTATDIIRRTENTHMEVALSNSVLKKFHGGVQVTGKKLPGKGLIKGRPKTPQKDKNSDKVALFAELITQAIKVYDGDSERFVRDMVAIQKKHLINSFDKKMAALVSKSNKPASLKPKK